jgi:uncharacterized protein DUF3617
MAQRDVSSARWFSLIVLLHCAGAASAEEFPALRPGLWEYQRTVQRSDQAWTPKDISQRVCEDPNTTLRKQAETFSKLGCTITSKKIDAENTYRMSAECATKNGERASSHSVTTFDGDTAYTSVIDSPSASATVCEKDNDRGLKISS